MIIRASINHRYRLAWRIDLYICYCNAKLGMKQSDIHGRSRIKKGKMFEDTNDVIISHNRIQLPSERGKKKRQTMICKILHRKN